MPYTVTKYPQGTFCWADAMSSDAPATKKFMSKLMGWTAKDLPTDQGGTYTMFYMGEHVVAGLGALPSHMKGIPSHWNSYVSVDDLSAIVKKAKQLGAKVTLPIMDVMEAGRIAGIQDPTGAHVMLWEPKNHIGAELVNTVGAMGWNELHTNDLKKAQEFYSDLLGWTYEESPGSDGDVYHSIRNNKRYNGGMMTIKKEWGDNIPPNWNTYFTVENIDESVQKAGKLGGTIKGKTIEAPGVGKFVTIADPAGAHFTLIQMAQDPEEWVE